MTTSTGAGATLHPASFTSRHADVAGVRLHYLDYGGEGGVPMLCVHGGAAHAHWFDFVASGFTARHHVRAIDLRGHGDSAWVDPPDYTYGRYAADLAAFVERLDLRDFVLVGHSMGGMVSLVYSATYPGRVAKLVVVDSTMHMTEERVSALRGVGSREGSSYETHEEFLARYRLRPAGTTAGPAVLRHLAQHSARQGADGAWRHKFDRNVYALREAIDGMPHWARIRVPALLVKGGRSQRLTPQIIANVQANCPQVVLAEVPDADHHVTLDNPTGFVESVNAFLGR